MLHPSILHGFRMTTAEQRLGVYGIHVYQEGRGCVEHRFRNDDEVNLYSASKTFTAVGIGIALDEGRLALSDPVISYFPEYEPMVAGGGEIHIVDLLHMTAVKPIFWPQPEKLLETDAAELFFRERTATEPGQHFFYSNLCTYMLGRIVQKVSGETLRDYLLTRLFVPLGIPFPQWHTCPRGHTLAATGLFLRTSELAKLGQLLLHEGEYQGRRIVSESFIRHMREDIVSTAHHSEDSQSVNGYGYQVWRCADPQCFRADGMYGQFSVVIPSKRAVATVTAHNENGALKILRAIFTDIEPLL